MIEITQNFQNQRTYLFLNHDDSQLVKGEQRNLGLFFIKFQLFNLESKARMKGPQILLKSERLGYFYCWIVTASMLIYGYSLTMLSASSLADIRQYYSITYTKDIILSTINGFFAIGGLLGSFLTPYFIKITTKKRSFYIFAISAVVSSGLVLIPNLGTLYLSRFIMGLTCAFSIGVAGMYVRQTFSQRLRRPFGSIYSLSKMIGTEICYILGYLLKQNSHPNGHLIVFCGAGVLSVIQFLFVIFFLPEIPVEMLSLNKFDRFNEVVHKLYNQQDIPRKIKQIQKQQKDMKAIPNLKVKATRHRVITALHSGLLRQFCGAPFVIVYSVYIFQGLQSTYVDTATLIINTVQVIAGCIGIKLTSSMRRSRLVIISTFLAAILSFVIAIGDGMGSSSLCLTAMILYMMPTASCLQSVTWFYPFECTGPLYGKYAALLSWFGTSCLLIIPPFVTQFMPQSKSYPIFIFFGVYLCFSIFINHRYFVNLDNVQVDVKKENAAIELTIITNRSQMDQ